LRILWVKAGKLLPVDTGGKIRSYHILKHLMPAHEVKLISYYKGMRDPEYENNLRIEFAEAEPIHSSGADGNGLSESGRYFMNLFSDLPYSIRKFTSKSVRERVADLLNRKEYDVAICDFLSASRSFSGSSTIPAILFQHNVESTLWRRMAETESHSLKRIAYRIEASRMLRYEREAIKRFQHVIAVSENDRQQMLAIDPSCEISVVPTGVDTQTFTRVPHADATEPRIVFVGSMDWEPNIDAVTYFVNQIFPKIRAEFPAATFHIVGRNPAPSVRRLIGPSILVTGGVPSVRPYLRDATVVVVPLQIGGGTRLKIFEAMAMGKALVSTTIGAEGLEVKNGRDLLLTDTPETFADAVRVLLRDSELRRRYEDAAARLAARFDWSQIAERFAGIVSGVIEQRSSESRPKSSRTAAQP